MASTSYKKDRLLPSLISTKIPVFIAVFWTFLALYSYLQPYLSVDIKLVPVKLSSESVLNENKEIRPKYYSIKKGVCLFISDAASGVGREAALLLADKGLYYIYLQWICTHIKQACMDIYLRINIHIYMYIEICVYVCV
jgi:hypothetical protein